MTKRQIARELRNISMIPQAYHAQGAEVVLKEMEAAISQLIRRAVDRRDHHLRGEVR